jgi:4-diphosphocytidyl-2-C-methyl-D-erythritol kinase
VLVRAPAKLNLCLYLGPRREDGLHEICSVFEPLTLEDIIRVEPGERDEVSCPGVDGENLALAALRELRAAGWEAPPQRIEIEKRIPVAAGLGGGSADAAAVLRLAAGEVADLEQPAARIGADVPSQLLPSFSLVRGAGEQVRRLPAPGGHGIVLLPDPDGLSTAEVYGEADRLGLGREAAELDVLAVRMLEATGAGDSPLSYADLLHNDLEPAALSLRPGIAAAKEELYAAGAELAAVTGSGPTVFGLFADRAAAVRGAEKIDRVGAIVCEGGPGP